MSHPALRARISRGALTANAAEAAAAGATDAVADLRRDAFGHGVAVVASTLVGAGVRAARIDDSDRDAAWRAGMTAVDAEPTLDAAVLYGLPDSGAAPVMRLTGTVLMTKPLRAGEGVSYGYTHRAGSDTRIALIAGGYGQGVVRALGNRASVDVGGRRCPIVGRVAMDVCVVDIGDSPVGAGVEVVFFGDGAVRDELGLWQRATGLTAAELVCAVGLRVPREDAA